MNRMKMIFIDRNMEQKDEQRVRNRSEDKNRNAVKDGARSRKKDRNNVMRLAQGVLFTRQGSVRQGLGKRE